MNKNLILIVSILFGLMFINSGLNKFFGYMPMPEEMPEKMITMMTGFGQIGWLMPLVAVVEILGGLLIMITMTRALGAVVIFPILVGIILTHAYTDPSGLMIPLVLLVIEIWILAENFRKYLPLIKD